MVSKIVDVGAKIDIRILSQLERSEKTGEEVHIYKSQVYDVLDTGEIELLMPTEGGKLILLPLGIRYEFVFYTRTGLFKSIGQVKERYKSENRYMVRIELNTPLCKFQRRQFYRLECLIDMIYFHITREQAESQTIDSIVEDLHNQDFYKIQKKARIVDISGGGVRFVTDENDLADSYILMIVVLDGGNGEKQYSIVGHVICSDRLDKTDVKDMKYENRTEFMLKDAKTQEEIIKFIFAEERRSRKNDKL